MPRRPMRILLVAAHPADGFDQAGGTLAHHAARGDKVTVAILTTGCRSHDWRLKDKKISAQVDLDVEPEMAAAIQNKLEEVRGACRILGFEDVRDLGFEDDDLFMTQEKARAIAEMIRDVKPDMIIAHHPFETGGLKTHATTGQATVFAWQIAQGSGRGRQVRHYAPVMYFMNPMAYMGANAFEYLGSNHVDIYVDITDVIDKKIQAMDHISSQYYSGWYARKRAETEDGAYGNLGRVGYAEAFQRYTPMVRYYLSMTEHELDTVEEPMEVYMARTSEMISPQVPLPAGAELTSRYRVPKEKYAEG